MIYNMIVFWCKGTAFLSIITIHKISQNVQNCRFFLAAEVLETKRGCVISHIPYALKGQKLLAQGIALGFRINTTKSP